MVDKMMLTYQKKKEEEFVIQGGIRERMTAARLGYRTNQRDALEAAKREIDILRNQIHALEQENQQLKDQINQLTTKKPGNP